jgi:hypothetical protein
VTAATSAGAISRSTAVIASSVATGTLAGAVYARVHGNRMAPWIIGRASGLVAYLLLVIVVLLGMGLAHPGRAERGRTMPTRMRVHVTLAMIALGLVVLHVVVLATDRYAGVGWWGAALPMGAHYRPGGVTLGVLGAWVGLLSGASAAVAGRLPWRMWLPLHRVAAVSFVLVWLHGVFAGSDTRVLLWLYLGSGVLVLGHAASRYTARTEGGHPRR